MKIFVITFILCWIPKSSAVVKEIDKNTNKRELVLSDLSYSFSATEIGSKDGSHVKTLSVIKNVSGHNSNKHNSHVDSDNPTNKPEEKKDDSSKPKEPYQFVADFSELPALIKTFNLFSPNDERKKSDIGQEINETVAEKQQTKTELPKIEQEITEALENKNNEQFESVEIEDKIEKTLDIKTDLKQNDTELFISDPIGPAQAKISAIAQQERLNEHVDKNTELIDTKLDLNIDVQQKSEQLVKLPPLQSSTNVDKKATQSKPYHKKQYNPSISGKRPGVFIPHFVKP